MIGIKCMACLLVLQSRLLGIPWEEVGLRWTHTGTSDQKDAGPGKSETSLRNKSVLKASKPQRKRREVA